ncbi:MAG TPA: pectinesterase family protein, partial [Steroidobacteraceae bacterium]|nr:pectinesterase family protein [Steroidobacteraceae bacterium]
ASHLLAADARITLGPSLGNLVPSGRNVTVSHAAGARPGAPLACASRFVPFPALATAPRLAVEVPAVDRTLYVAADGTGDFYSIQRAIDVAPASGALISVAPGIYREALTIAKPHLVLRSPYADPGRTIVVAPAGAAPSATLDVKADEFLAENLTVERKADGARAQPAAGPRGVALEVSGDRDVFHNVRVLGDTFFATRAAHAAGDDTSRRPPPPAARMH